MLVTPANSYSNYPAASMKGNLDISILIVSYCTSKLSKSNNFTKWRIFQYGLQK